MSNTRTDFVIKKGDLYRSLQGTIKRNGTAIDVSGATVTFNMLPLDSTTLKVDGGSVTQPGGTGVVKYTWASGDTDTAGTFKGEFIVTWPGSKPERFPNRDFVYIKIIDNTG